MKELVSNRRLSLKGVYEKNGKLLPEKFLTAGKDTRWKKVPEQHRKQCRM